MLHEMGIETGIDLDRLLDASSELAATLGRPLGSHTLLAGPVSWAPPASRPRPASGALSSCSHPAPPTIGFVTGSLTREAAVPLPRHEAPSLRRMLNKVPEVTVYFWVIKVLCTTVGETAADFLNDNLGLGLTEHDVVMSAVLVARARLPVPAAALRAGRLLARGRADQRRRHADHRQPDRQLRRLARDRRRSSSAIALAVDVRGLVRERAHALDPHDLHDAGARRSTGWPCCSRSRSARPPAT